MNPSAPGGHIDDASPLFLQIAEQVEDSIVEGSLAEETQAPSTNELAAFYRINPATAAKGLNLLVDKGVLYKRRGIGMFVARGARQALLLERRAAFAARYLEPVITEAERIGIEIEDLTALLVERATKEIDR